MKLKEIIAVNSALRTIDTIKLKMPLSYKMAKMARTVREEIEVFNESRDNLIVKYADKDKETNEPKVDEGGNYTITEKVKEFNEELNAMLDVEIDKEFPNFNIGELTDLELSTRDMEALLPFIVE